MADIPIIFSAPMIRALLGGQKTMTRRLAWRETTDRPAGPGYKPSPWQRVKPGDRLWVRENLCQRRGEFLGRKQNVIEARYAADEAEVLNPDEFNLLPWWEGSGGLPSIHMPRRVSRITIAVTSTKIEPVQDISEEDAAAEGIVAIPRSLTRHGRMDGYGAPGTPPEEVSTTRVNGFRALWCKLHGTPSWDANPEVVAMAGRVILHNIDSEKARQNG